MRPTADQPAIYFITTVTKGRRRLFDDVLLAERLATMIRLASQSKGYVLLGYCILLDHLHLLIWPSVQIPAAGILERMPLPNNNYTEGALSRAPAVGDVLKSIKGTFSRTMLQGHIWQPRYNLRHVMTPEDLERTVLYMQHNYQKHRLPERFGREPYVWLNTSILERMLQPLFFYPRLLLLFCDLIYRDSEVRG